MKLTPAYVRSELQRISEDFEVQSNGANPTVRGWARAQQVGGLEELLNQVLRYGLAEEMEG